MACSYDLILVQTKKSARHCPLGLSCPSDNYNNGEQRGHDGCDFSYFENGPETLLAIQTQMCMRSTMSSIILGDMRVVDFAEKKVEDVASHDWTQRDDAPILTEVTQSKPFKCQDRTQAESIQEGNRRLISKRGYLRRVFYSQGAVHEPSQ